MLQLVGSYLSGFYPLSYAMANRSVSLDELLAM